MATIVVPAVEVIDAAEKVIARILKKREAENAEAIRNCIENSIPGRFRKLFGAKPMTEEQADRYLREQDGWFYPSIRAWGTLGKAEKLLKLAKHGDPVTLNEDDVEVLF